MGYDGFHWFSHQSVGLIWISIFYVFYCFGSSIGCHWAIEHKVIMKIDIVVPDKKIGDNLNYWWTIDMSMMGWSGNIIIICPNLSCWQDMYLSNFLNIFGQFAKYGPYVMAHWWVVLDILLLFVPTCLAGKTAPHGGIWHQPGHRRPGFAQIKYQNIFVQL